MKRNLVTGILTLICVFFIVFANIKANEAEKQTLLAMENYRKSQELEESMNVKIKDLEARLDSMKHRLTKCQIIE